MGDSKLYLLLLLSTSALTLAQEEDHPTCLLAQRYKTLHKYEYQYEAESLNGINGASQLRNGPKASCKVEIEVPQTCSFIVRTTGCSLSEVVDMDAEGNPVFGPAPSSDAFAAEMERYPLKVVVEGEYDVKLYPEDGESTNILNFKRGIISALAVPLMEEDKNKIMPTIHGKCRTYYTINSREDIATDISLKRDLSRCDKFVPMKDHTSPLALVSGMHYPLSQLVRSSQSCNYKFDNEKKHMTSGSCTEKHILIPFSHKGEYGVTNVGKQELTLVEVTAHNDRVFEHSDIVKGLHMEKAEDKSVVQDKDAALSLLRELATLPETDGDRRAQLFQRLVSIVHGMKIETLSPAIPEALEVSRVLTYQVLAQCGTPECSSAIMQILRSFDIDSIEVDASVFALGLMSNPSELLINDMLQMAKYKSSKPIMYALSNVVKRFYKAEGKLIPEIYSVAEFMAAKLGDCSGDKDEIFMTLRVIGNMAPAVISAGPALRGAVMQCVNQPAASLAVQQAAIQVFRLIPAPEEVREVFMQVLLDGTSPVQKRIAAYLVLMKDPLPSELSQLANALSNEQDQQVKNFIESHLSNILTSTMPETQELRQKILDALQGNEINAIREPTKFSRNYKIGSLEGNMIFEGSSYLPKEAMLDMTLKAFGFDIDMMEIGMEGKGFEPTVDALFGENGFFPDTALKTMYFVSDNMPQSVTDMIYNIMPALRRNRMKRQVSTNFMRDIGRNLNKLIHEFKNSESPEAMIYLRLLGNELGYLKTNEMEEMAYSAVMMIDSMLKMFPTDVMKALLTKADNTIFAHYIFMDNEFFLPTMTGVPLKIALSGTFTPGLKGGLQMARDMSKMSFMPSAGIEFVTRVGSHFPEYVDSGLEMHTNLFHESGIRAEISMGRDNIKLTIPAPTSPTKLIKMTNNLVAITGTGLKSIPSMLMDKVDISECTPFFAGMKYCTALQYTDAFSQETSPYFPFTGDSKFVMELHPTGEVTEYTTTVSYEVLNTGEEGKEIVDSLKFVVRAEGAVPTEATATLNYNRRKNVVTADIQIPDYDLEAGLRLGVVDGNTKGKGTHSISLDLINKNIPQLSLVGRANLKEMKEGMLQVQLLIPAIKADATVTASMKREEELELELKTDIKFMETTSEQTFGVKYDASKIEFEAKSDVSSEILNILPNADMVEKYTNDLLDMPIGDTDIKARYVLSRLVEAINNYMEKYGADFPYIQNFRVPAMPEISVPEKLFLNVDTKAVYYFNNARFIIDIPVPLGGKSAKELNFPSALSTPHVAMPQFGLEIVSMEVPIPDFFIPEKFTFVLPYFGKAEVSADIKSNLYDMEASMMFGKDTMEEPRYSTTFDVKGTSPIEILSVKAEGIAKLDFTEAIKAELKSSLAHKLIEASINIIEDASITDKLSLKSSSKFEAISPLGLNIVFDHTGTTGINTEELSGNYNFEGSAKIGPIFGKTISSQSFAMSPFKPEANFDSNIQVDTSVLKARNTIQASLASGRINFVSNTNALEDSFTHIAELVFRNSRLSVRIESNALALGLKLHNLATASTDLKDLVANMETTADYKENRVYSMLAASLDARRLTLNNNANMKLLENEAVHKFDLTLNKDGLATSGITTIQSPLSFENTFSAGLDGAKATLSISNKAALSDMALDNTNTMMVTLSGLDFNSKAEATVGTFVAYTHDITADMKPYTASANVRNNFKLLGADFINEAQLQAELYKMDLTGSMKALFGEEEFKHTYQVSYADMIANAKCSTTGKLFGTHMNQNTEVEMAGLAFRVDNDARFNSQPVRYDHNIRCNIVPFDFNLGATFNADGDVALYGKHSAQLFGKFLFRAKPLALSSSHEYRASLTQKLDNGFSLESTFDNKMETTMSMEEQMSTLRTKSKMNDHVMNQDFAIYNNPERVGIEASGTILTNILNTLSDENQEYTISSFLKYDKSTESHVIRLPLIENLPLFLDSIKNFAVLVAETLQDFLNNEEIRGKIEALPQYVKDVVDQMNLEERVIQLKQYSMDFVQNYAITMDDVESALINLKETVENLFTDLRGYIQKFADAIVEVIKSSTFPETIALKIQELLDTITEEFDIKAMTVTMIDYIREMIVQLDLEKLKGTSIAFLIDLEAKYDIKHALKDILKISKDIVMDFKMTDFVTKLRRFVLSFRFNRVIENLFDSIPLDKLNDAMKYIKEAIQDLDIVGKINSFSAKMRELIVKFELDQKVQAIFEKTVEFIKSMEIEETISNVFKMVKDQDIPAKLMDIYQDIINYLKSTEVSEMIKDINMKIEAIVETLKSMDYNDLVEYVNNVIGGFIYQANEMIKGLEIPQKLEATREFINVVLSSVRSFMERLQNIKIADAIKTGKEFFDNFVIGNMKTIVQFVNERITNLDVKATITPLVEFFARKYRTTVNIVSDIIWGGILIIRGLISDQKLFKEMNQIVDGLSKELKKTEIVVPSLTIPFTDLVVPSFTVNEEILKELEIPTQVDIPEFTILGFYNVKATTISFDDIKQKIVALLDFILNFEIALPDVDALFGEMTLDYLPSFPEITFPEIGFSEISFPTIPQIPVEKYMKVIQVPEIKVPAIPAEIMIPAFGKLYGEIRFITPIYTMKTSAEFKNTTESEMTPQFTSFFTSQGASPNYELLNYKFETTARIAIPKRSRLVLAETLKISHDILGVEHQASVTLYGFSAQAQAKTTLKFDTKPYTANFMNTAFIAMEGGISASLDTSFTEVIDLPVFRIRGESSVTQRTVLRQDGFSLTITGENTAIGKLNENNCNHNSKVQMSLKPRIITLTFNGDTDSSFMKLKQLINAELGPFSFIKFTIRNEAEAPIIKNSLFVMSGNANLYDMNIELKGNHDAELIGPVSGVLSNSINVVAHPMELLFEFQNKGNAKVNIFETVSGKIDLQNDYLANIKPESQVINTVALVRLNPHKIFYNFTLHNDVKEAGFFAAIESEANLDFLKYPISIAEIDLPFIDFHTPAISDLNLYEQFGMENFLTTTEQNFDTNAKIVYKKSQAAPLVDLMGLLVIPSVGNVITELSFKSAIINFNANAGLSAEDDIVLRLGATTTSVFEGLNAKLDGTTSLTTKRGIKLANSLSLENRHVEGTHDSTFSLSTDTFEAAASMSTVGKVISPMVNLEANQNLVADTKTKANVASTLRMKGDFNCALINAAVKAETDHSLKLEGAFDYISMESSTRANVDGTVLDDYLLLGVLDNEANMYLNKDGLRSTSKIIADAKFNHGTTKIFGMDVNENLALEGSLSRVYAVFKYTGNNEANVYQFFTNGKHVAHATIDFAPLSSLALDFEFDMSQPSSLGDFTIFEKTIAEVTGAKQKISTNTKVVSPLYTTNTAVELDGIVPVFKVTFKSSATSPMVLLEYDVDASSTANFETEALSVISKGVLTHADLTMEINHIISQALSSSRHTLNVDITSPTFTDMNLRYAARRDGISASVSSPSAGFLGFTFNSRAPLSARVYGRYPSAPEVDVDILVLRSSPKDADEMGLQLSYNMMATKTVISEFKTKLPSIISALKAFTDKYQITSMIETLTRSFFTELQNLPNYYDVHLSQMSIFFRNVVVHYQKTVQAILDAAIKLLRETQFKLPGSDEMTTLPVMLKKLTGSIASVLDVTLKKIIENIEAYYNVFVEQISSVKVRMPVGDAITGGQIIEKVKTILKTIADEMVDFVQKMESIDTMLEKIGETLKAVVEKSQDFVDSVKSDYLDSVFVHINGFYNKLVTISQDLINQLPIFTMEDFTKACDTIMDMIIKVVEQFNNTIYGFLQQVPEIDQSYLKVKDEMIVIDLPFFFLY